MKNVYVPIAFLTASMLLSGCGNSVDSSNRSPMSLASQASLTKLTCEIRSPECEASRKKLAADYSAYLSECSRSRSREQCEVSAEQAYRQWQSMGADDSSEDASDHREFCDGSRC